MAHLVGVGDASMTARGDSAGMSGGLYLYPPSCQNPELLYEFDMHIPMKNISDAESCVSVYLASLMDARFTHKKIRCFRLQGGLRSASVLSDRQTNLGKAYWLWHDAAASYFDKYEVPLDLKWESNKSDCVQQ